MDRERVLVTGSAGHLGEALVRTLQRSDFEVVGLDVLASPFTDVVASVADRATVRDALSGVGAVIHTAALQKPHIGSHSRQAFVATNVTGTLVLLEEAADAGVESFVFTSSTSAFGKALTASGDQAAGWITEDLRPIPRNIYGVTKIAAEELCELAHHELGLAVVILRTSRFFPEFDDNEAVRSAFSNDNVKANEFLYRRIDLADAVDAHLLAVQAAPSFGFERLILSATTPFRIDETRDLAADAPAVVAREFPDQPAEYERRGWRMFRGLDRVYDNARARAVLGWNPKFDFRRVLDQLKADEPLGSELARTVGAKGYHDVTTGVYTTR